MDAVEHDLTPEQWALLQEVWGRVCLLRRHRRPAAARLRPGPVPRWPLSLRRPRPGRTGSFYGLDGRKRLDERSFPVRHDELRMLMAQQFALDADDDEPVLREA